MIKLFWHMSSFIRLKFYCNRLALVLRIITLTDSQKCTLYLACKCTGIYYNQILDKNIFIGTFRILLTTSCWLDKRNHFRGKQEHLIWGPLPDFHLFFGKILGKVTVRGKQVFTCHENHDIVEVDRLPKSGEAL